MSASKFPVVVVVVVVVGSGFRRFDDSRGVYVLKCNVRRFTAKLDRTEGKGDGMYIPPVHSIGWCGVRLEDEIDEKGIPSIRSIFLFNGEKERKGTRES